MTWTSSLRRARNATLPLLACTVLASCANLAGPREIAIPLAKMQAGLDRRFPLNNRALELFDIQLSRPQLSLLAGSDRVALSMDALVAPPFLKQSWSGSLALSGRLVIDPARGAVLITEPHVERFAVDGVGEARQRQLGQVANVLMNKVLVEAPVYSFRMEDLRYAGVQFIPTRISSRPDALLIRIEPVR